MFKFYYRYGETTPWNCIECDDKFQAVILAMLQLQKGYMVSLDAILVNALKRGNTMGEAYARAHKRRLQFLPPYSQHKPYWILL